MDREKTKRDASVPAGGGRYPVLSQTRAFPGLFAGTLGATATLAAGLVLPEAAPVMTAESVLVAAAPLAGLIFGVDIGWDGSVPPRLAQRLQPVGFALLILPWLVGLVAGSERFVLSWISVSALAHALGSIAVGQKVSGADPGASQS